MRSIYPLCSQELNDLFLEIYARYVHLLGRDDEAGFTTYSGFYDISEQTINTMVSDYVVLRNNKVTIVPSGYTVESSGTYRVPITYKLDSYILRNNLIRGR